MLEMLLLAGALVLFFEGVLYALFPDGMKRMMISVLEMPSGNLRMAGLVAAVLGLFLTWLIKG
ncbi:MAG: DUF2065 domain-containing protein [Sneathiella sp.]